MNQATEGSIVHTFKVVDDYIGDQFSETILLAGLPWRIKVAAGSNEDSKWKKFVVWVQCNWEHHPSSREYRFSTDVNLTALRHPGDVDPLVQYENVFSFSPTYINCAMIVERKFLDDLDEVTLKVDINVNVLKPFALPSTRNALTELSGVQLSGTIVEAIEDIQDLNENYLQTVVIGDIPWKLETKFIRQPYATKHLLRVKLSCDWEDPRNIWACRAKTVFSINDHSETQFFTYSAETKSCELNEKLYGYLDMSEFVVDDEIEIKVDINIVTLHWIPIVQKADSKVSNFEVSLRFPNYYRTIKVKRLDLCLCSNMFRDRLDLAHSNTRGLVINHMHPDEFMVMLRVMNGTESISAQNIRLLLKLSQQTESSWLKQTCEQFLITTETIQIGDKYMIAVQFMLDNVLKLLDQTGFDFNMV